MLEIEAARRTVPVDADLYIGARAGGAALKHTLIYECQNRGHGPVGIATSKPTRVKGLEYYLSGSIGARDNRVASVVFTLHRDSTTSVGSVEIQYGALGVLERITAFDSDHEVMTDRQEQKKFGNLLTTVSGKLLHIE